MVSARMSKVGLAVAECGTACSAAVGRKWAVLGLIAAILTEVPGSSDVFERAFVTYSNAAKTETLGVPAARPTPRSRRRY